MIRTVSIRSPESRLSWLGLGASVLLLLVARREGVDDLVHLVLGRGLGLVGVALVLEL